MCQCHAHAGFHGAHGNVQSFSDFFVSQAGILPEQENVLFFGAELADGGPNPLPFVDCRRLFQRCWMAIHHLVDLLGQRLALATPRGAAHIPTRIERDTENPGF